MVLSPSLRQVAVVIAANLSVMSTGVGLSWSSPTLVLLSDAAISPLGHALTTEQASWILSLGGMAGLPGALLAGTAAGALGRKYTILAASLPKLAGWALVWAASDVRMLYAARMLQGLADSVTFSVVPTYAAEVSSQDIRGSLGTVLQVMCTLGIVTTLCIGPFLSYAALAAFCTAATALGAIPVLFLPESPHFSYSRGKKDEALKVLTLLRGSGVQAAEAIKEFEDNDGKEKPKVSELLRSRATVRALLTVAALGLGAQASGFNAVTFSLQAVLESTRTGVRSEVASAAVGGAQLLACLLTACVAERFGRKPILCGTLTIMFLGLMSLGAFFKLSELGYSTRAGPLQYLPLASILVVVCGYSGGLGSIMWPLIAELFNDEARSLGVSVGVFSAVLSTFLSTRFFYPLVELVGSAATFWLFGGSCLLLALFVLLYVPETKGKSFAQIQSLLHKEQQSSRAAACAESEREGVREATCR